MLDIRFAQATLHAVVKLFECRAFADFGADFTSEDGPVLAVTPLVLEEEVEPLDDVKFSFLNLVQGLLERRKHACESHFSDSVSDCC
jgi:hypothetical protein